MRRTIFKGLFPICNTDEYSLLCFKNGSFYILNTQSLSNRFICHLQVSFLKRIFIHFSILRRYFGLYNIKGIKINDNHFLIWYHRSFYILDLSNCSIKFLESNSRYSVLHLNSSTKGVIWGEYGYNPQKKSKSVYLFNEERNKIECLYTFSDGEINHIHNIIEDREKNRFYILTGDFDDSAGIYFTDDNFQTVTPLVSGSQNFRSCFAIPYHNKLLYATDSPTQTNHLYELNTGMLRVVKEINGSCIHACRLGDFFVGSTTVENQPDEVSNERNRFRYNLGKGIKNWYVEVFSFNLLTGEYKILLKAKKDILPMLAFGYGLFSIPKLSDDYRGKLALYGQSIRGYDQKLVVIE